MKEILEIREECDNIWGKDYYLRIYKTKTGYRLLEEIPSGYSSYTYDPDTTTLEMDGDWQTFWDICLTTEYRHALELVGFSRDKEP